VTTAVALAQTQPATRPAGVDDATWRRMLQIDQKGATVTDLSADFEQRKVTAMLKKPLVSSGRVYVRGSAMLWATEKPEPNVLQITAREARIYYPSQKTIEVYPIEQKLGELAASPLPRLATLQQHFTFEPLPLAEMGEKNGGGDGRYLALKMTPTNPALREHVEQVRVLLDSSSGLIVRLEMRDADGDRTLLTFSSPKINAGLKEQDLEIKAPPDVKVTHPLGALEGSSR
jgi:outer membrane lipoprotein carrier protein